MSNRVVAVVPAAGCSTRMGGSTPKQFLTLGNLPLLVHTLRILDVVDAVAEIVLVIPESDRELCEKDILHRFPIKKVSKVVPGGVRRQDSVKNGLFALSGPVDYILVHDGARPFLTKQMVTESIDAAIVTGASVVGLPIGDTVKRAGSTGMIEATLDREELWLAQTPQVFRYEWLMKAHEVANQDNLNVTDDSSMVERLGYPVALVTGSAFNIKITRPEDLKLGEAILSVQGFGRVSSDS